MPKKKKGNYKKSRVQLQEYRSFISNPSFSPQGTIPSSNEMLKGSGEYGYDQGKLESSEKIKRTPLKYRILDWLKEHIIPAVIIAIVIAIGTAVISHQINLAVVSKQLEFLDKRIEQIESDYVEKEILQSKINEIKTDIDSTYSLTLNDIKWQLNKLEEELDSLK